MARCASGVLALSLRLLYWARAHLGQLYTDSEGRTLSPKRTEAAAEPGDGWWVSKRNKRQKEGKEVKEYNDSTWPYHHVLCKAMECILISHQGPTFWYLISHPQEVSAKSVCIRPQGWSCVIACYAQGAVSDTRGMWWCKRWRVSSLWWWSPGLPNMHLCNGIMWVEGNDYM